MRKQRAIAGVAVRRWHTSRGTRPPSYVAISIQSSMPSGVQSITHSAMPSLSSGISSSSPAISFLTSIASQTTFFLGSSCVIPRGLLCTVLGIMSRM